MNKNYVFRPDGAELYRLRNGEYSLEQVEAMIEKEKLLCDEALTTTKLPKEPDYEFVNGMLTNLLLKHCNDILNNPRTEWL